MRSFGVLPSAHVESQAEAIDWPQLWVLQIGSENSAPHILADGRVPGVFHNADNLDVGRDLAGTGTKIVSQGVLWLSEVAARETLIYDRNFLCSEPIRLFDFPASEQRHFHGREISGTYSGPLDIHVVTFGGMITGDGDVTSSTVVG